MRTTTEYLALQLAYDPERLRALAVPDYLTTARFEAVYREMAGFGMLDLVFECGDELFVAHAVNVDVVVLATREGPALIWPATLAIDEAAAAAIEAQVTPWLRSLLRGRAVAGEYVRAYRSSPAFVLARERGLRGAVPTARTLPLMAPFVYARRFARDRDVFVGCAQRALAAAVVGTVARRVVLGGACDPFAERWYGRPVALGGDARADLAIVDELDDPAAAGFRDVVATRPAAGAHNVIVPVPAPNDHLFTFDPADAPAASSFAVRAADRAERAPRRAAPPAPVGGSGGRVALVMRDDYAVAPDADVDAVEELARRLTAEGLDARLCAAGDPSARDADIVHVFGAPGDSHVATAGETARGAGLPLIVSVEPPAPFARYHEEASMMTLRVCVDDTDRAIYLRMFDERRLRFDGVPIERTPQDADLIDRGFEAAARGASAFLLAPGADADAFAVRFPAFAGAAIASVPVPVAPEPPEAALAARLPAGPFMLVHGPLTRRSAFGYLLAVLGETPYDIVVAGPISEVDVAATLRRVCGANVVFLPDPTPGEVAALYRRARAIAIPALRPPSPARLLRAAACGTLPLVAAASPLALLVPDHLRFDVTAHAATRERFNAVMGADRAPEASELARRLAPLFDQRAALAAVVERYAHAAAAAAAR